MIEYEELQQSILEEIGDALNKIKNSDVQQFLEEIQNANKVFFVGVGRSLLSLKSVAKRLAHLGIETYIVGETIEPAINEKDILIVGSGSGESIIPLNIAAKAKQFDARVIHLGANSRSSMKKYTDFFVSIPVNTKYQSSEKIKSIQPMTSLFEQTLLLLGDTLALMLIKKQNMDTSNLWRYHANLE